MLVRCIVILLLCCTACRTGIIPCPEPKGLKLKKSPVGKRYRGERNPTRDEQEPVITVSSDARTPQTNPKKNKYKYVEYTIQHVDVEDLDCPRPGEKKVMPRAIRENIRKNRKKVRYYYREARADSLNLMPSGYQKR
jgi:hypothetical protein